jgi:hypothetical protein
MGFFPQPFSSEDTVLQQHGHCWCLAVRLRGRTMWWTVKAMLILLFPSGIHLNTFPKKYIQELGSSSMIEHLLSMHTQALDQSLALNKYIERYRERDQISPFAGECYGPSNPFRWKDVYVLPVLGLWGDHTPGNSTSCPSFPAVQLAISTDWLDPL